MRLSSLLFAPVTAFAIASAPVRAEPLPVELIRVQPETLVRSYSLTGEIRASNQVSVSFPSAGRVVDVLVEEGARVTAGTVLARIDSVQQVQHLRAAEAGLETAKADRRQAQEDFDRASALLESGATTRAARDAAADALRIAEGALSRAEAELDRAKKAVEDTEIVAKQDATVIRRMVEAGQVVGAAQPVYELALSNAVEAVFDVPEVFMTQGTAGGEIRLERLDAPGDVFVGTISDVAPLVDPASGTVEVTVRIDAPPEGLAFGEPVVGTAQTELPDRIVLPYTVLSAVGDKTAVWTVDPSDNTVSLRPITVELYDTGVLLVAEGLAPGDVVVGRGAQLLYPGREVFGVEVSK